MKFRPIVYDLNNELLFGKYKGKTVDLIIRRDPWYIQWMIDEIKTITFTDRCHALLDSFRDDNGVDHCSDEIPF